MKNKHTSMWIIHIKLKCSGWEENFNNNVTIMFMQIDKDFYECLITCQSEKNTSEIGVKLLLFFTFFINLFMKTLIKNIFYGQTVPLERLRKTKNCMSRSSAFALNLSKSGNIFWSMANGNCPFNSASVIVIGRR